MPLRDPAWVKPISPVIFRISSRPQPPAWESAPCAQFRKNLWRMPNHRPKLGFWRCQQSFRNWAQGGSPSAGAYSPAGLPDLAGSLTAQTNGASPIYVGSGAFSVNGNSSYVPQGNTGSGAKGSLTMSFAASAYNQIFGGADTVMPSSVNQPLVIYLGRPA